MVFRSGISVIHCLTILLGIALDSSRIVEAIEPGEADVNRAGDMLTFERDVRPILRAHCLDCHGAIDEKDGNLDLRLVRFMELGGDSGPALIKGDAAASLIVQRVKSGEMPPGEAKVSANELAILERWIAEGAATARPEPMAIGPGLPILPEDRQWWAFQPIRRPQVDSIVASAHAADDFNLRTDVDALVMRAMPRGLSLSPDADKRTLMVRLYFDLTGLPPTPEQVSRYMSDESPDAYERLVDELLESPQYGQRWARHWLDVAGYCDSEGGNTTDAVRPWAYKYRDYVIQSFNADKPLDRFIHEQLAGDELAGPITGDLTPEQIELLTATGFLRMAADGTGSGSDSEEARNQVIADSLKIVSSSLLGLSFACAQCHDHRYDPISHTDYFALRAVFEPALDWKNWKTPSQRYVSLYTSADRAKAAEVEAEALAVSAEREEKQRRYMAEAIEKEFMKYDEPLRQQLKEAYESVPDKRTEVQKALLDKHPSVNITPGVLYQYNQAAADELKKDADRITEIRARKPREEFLRVLSEPPGHVPETLLFHRGDHRQPKQQVAPAAPAVLCPEESFVSFAIDDDALPTTGRRLAFARWLTSDQNPITARVMANRLWLHLMGRGLVATPADFGRLGAKPTHPELLDYLASELMRNGWSAKRLQRLIVTSSVYRQSSFHDPEKAAIDDDNQSYWRSIVKRLDAEVIRDRLLATTGQLDPALFGPATLVKEDETGQIVVDTNDRRRSIYIQQRRSQPVAMLQAFDAPVMETNCELRPSSTVATQSLMLMNGEFVLSQAETLASAVLAQADEASSIDPALDLSGLPALGESISPVWQMGYGSVDEATGRTGAFTPLPHFEGGTWQGSAARPDPKIGWVLLHATGGHTGDQPGFSAIRRWTSPVAGRVRITGVLEHHSENGDGVRGRIVSSRSGIVGQWITHHAKADTNAESFEVMAGDTIDFVTDCRDNVNSDSFNWVVELTVSEANGTASSWKSDQGFSGPVGTSVQLRVQHLVTAWQKVYLRRPSREELELAIQFVNEQIQEMTLHPRALPGNVSPAQQSLINLCQALLTSNEFLYVK